MIQTYQQLFDQAMDHLRALAPESWTDHNAADPGITLLEQLCYALTDLDYRIHFPIPDHLAPGENPEQTALFSARKVLTTAPLSYQDYQKVMLDQAGIKSAAIRETSPSNLYHDPFSKALFFSDLPQKELLDTGYQPVTLQGIYNLELGLHQDVNPAQAMTTIWARMQNNRNLCTDFEQTKVLEGQAIRLNIDIELGFSTDLETLFKAIWQRLDQYISPSIPFSNLQDTPLDQHTEDWFEGPALNLGFLLNTNPSLFQRRTTIRRSDLIREIMALAPKVKTVRRLEILTEESGFEKDKYLWLIELAPDKTPYLDWNNFNIRFFQEDVEIPVPSMTQPEHPMPEPPAAQGLDYEISLGKDRKVAHYTSVRDHLPEIYGITPFGLPQPATTAQKGQAKQLSAYLLFFEQILANHFSQLANVPHLFSIDREETDTQTYFNQTIDHIPAVEGLFSTADALDRLQAMDGFTETPTQRNQRSNRILDHFLARFSEQLVDNFIDTPDLQERAIQTIQAKRNFLQQYPTTSYNRGIAPNYTNPTASIGFYQRVSQLLGFDINDPEFDFYLVEHLLLRPIAEDQVQEDTLLAMVESEDPFSLQISYIFPLVGRFTDENGDENGDANKSFRQFTARLLRDETPAHIQIQLYWLSPEAFATFSEAYQTFMESLQNIQNNENPSRISFRGNRDRIMDLLFQYHTAGSPMGVPYPIRDLPVTIIMEEMEDDSWRAILRLENAQQNVTYQLCNRDKQPNVVDDISGESIDVSGMITPGDQTLDLISPRITKDRTYWIRAEKTIHREDKSYPLRYVFLLNPIRIQVGIHELEVRAVPPEIDAGELGTVELIDTQAGVYYRLFINGVEVSESGEGIENANILISTTADLYEDAEIVVWGSRNDFSDETGSKIVGITTISVRPITNFNIIPSPAVIPFGSSPDIELVPVAGENSTTQAGVTYTLYSRDVADAEFVHHKANPPQGDAVLDISHPEGLALIQRPTRPNGDQFRLEDNPPAPYTRLASATVEQNGDPLRFENLGSFQEDTLFLVAASKPDQENPVIVGTGNLASIGVVLVQPDPSPTIEPASPISIPSGTRGIVNVLNTQAGVKYYLRYSNGIRQEANYHHDETENSPRQDGVDLSKVGVDTVVGPPSPKPLEVGTNNPRTQNTTVNLVAEKIQTGLTITIMTGIIFEIQP